MVLVLRKRQNERLLRRSVDCDFILSIVVVVVGCIVRVVEIKDSFVFIFMKDL